jgi:hypothetical protein
MYASVMAVNGTIFGVEYKRELSFLVAIEEDDGTYITDVEFVYQTEYQPGQPAAGRAILTTELDVSQLASRFVEEMNDPDSDLFNDQ